MGFLEPRLERDEVLFFALSEIAEQRPTNAQLGRAHEGSHVEARAIDRAERRRRRNEMDGAAKAFGPARNRHANNGADLMAGGVIGRQSRTGKQESRECAASAGKFSRSRTDPCRRSPGPGTLPQRELRREPRCSECRAPLLPWRPPRHGNHPFPVWRKARATQLTSDSTQSTRT